MGVKHLQTFLQIAVPNGIMNVSIKDECATYFKKHNRRPIIVVDLLALMRFALDDLRDTLCAGRHNVYYSIYENLLKNLADFADLVFFEDGPVLSQKMHGWIKRYDERYDQCIEIMDSIDQRYSLQEITEYHQEIPFFISHLNIVKNLARKYGEVIVTVTQECDSEIARYAALNERTMAILADDTDFLIFTGKWKLFSIIRMNADTLTTVEWNRDALREHLQLNDLQLIALSTLNGNDVISIDENYAFHNSLIGYFTKNCVIRIMELAKFIKEQLPNDKEGLVKAIARNVFCHPNTKRVEKSFNLYNIDFEVLEPTDALMKLCREQHFNFVYSVLKRLPKNFALLYYDLRGRTFPNLHVCMMKLYRKQIGIITKNEPNTVLYEVVTKASHEDRYRSFKVTSIMPPFETPPLIELLQRDNFPAHDELRFELLKWTIGGGEKFQNFDLGQIPPNFIHDILILTHLVSEKFMSVFEADVILLSIKKVMNNAAPKVVPPTHLHPRAFRIAFLFGKYHVMIERSLEATGLKSLKGIICFDGVLFHNLYLVYREKPFDALLLGELTPYRLYA